MFNPFTFQGATATVEPQAIGMNGHSRIPEFTGQPFGHLPVGMVPVNPMSMGQQFGLPFGLSAYNYAGTQVPTIGQIPGIPAYGINPMTTPFINHTSPGFAAYHNAYVPNTAWNTPFVNPIVGGIHGVLPTNPYINNTLAATTVFGVPSIAPNFNSINNACAYAGVTNPMIPTTSPVTALNNPLFNAALNPVNPVMPFVNPMAMINAINPAAAIPAAINPVNAWVNPITTGINQILTNAAVNTAIAANLAHAVASCPVASSIYGAAINPAVNPIAHAGIGSINPIVNIHNRAILNSLVTPFGVNPITAAWANPVHNPIAATNPYIASTLNNLPFGNPINSIYGNTFGALNNPLALNPITAAWNTLHANPWITNPLAAIGTPGVTGLNTAWTNPLVAAHTPFMNTVNPMACAAYGCF